MFFDYTFYLYLESNLKKVVHLFQVSDFNVVVFYSLFSNEKDKIKKAQYSGSNSSSITSFWRSIWLLSNNAIRLSP